MKGSAVVLGQLAGRGVAARMIDGQLDDLLIDLPEIHCAPEAICRARVGRPVKGLGGVFVDLPGGANGFLKAPRGLRPGAPVLVQVSGFAEPGKAVPVTTRLLFKGRFAIVTPGAPGCNVSRAIRDPGRAAALEALAAHGMEGAAPDMGLIVRSAAEWADDAEVADDIAAMHDLARAVLGDLQGPPELLVDAPDTHAIAAREWSVPAPDLFDDSPTALHDHAIPEAIAALLDPVVPLAEGHMAIEPTRALIAVDVNTGADTSPAAGLKANIAAARDLPRQLRLRGLGGQVVIDFAPCPKRDRQVVEQALQAAFRRDGAQGVLAGWTALGNFELTRRRDRMPLAALPVSWLQEVR